MTDCIHDLTIEHTAQSGPSHVEVWAVCDDCGDYLTGEVQLEVDDD